MRERSLMNSTSSKHKILKDFYETRIWKFHYGMELYERIRLQNLFEILTPKPTDIFLDAGCGGCIYTKQIADISTVVAADISRRGLKIAKEELTGFSARIHFVVCDNESLPLSDESVDKIVTIDTLEHMRDVKAFFEEAKRLLKPKGKISIFTACGKNKFTLEHILKPFPVLGRLIEAVRSKFGHINIFTTQYLRDLVEPDFEIMRIRYMHHWFGWLFKFLWDIRNIDSTKDCSKLPKFKNEISATFSQVIWQALKIEYKIFKKFGSGSEIMLHATKKSDSNVHDFEDFEYHTKQLSQLLAS